MTMNTGHTTETSKLMEVPGLISPDERELVRSVSEMAEQDFQTPTIVHLGVFLGASCYCSRAGAPHATIYGVDVNEHGLGPSNLRDQLALHFILGDTRTVEFDKPIHMIFVDATHAASYVTVEIQKWVLPLVVVGGYALFHDAFYTPDNTFFKLMAEVSGPIDTLLSAKFWEEQEIVDTVRWFKRLA